MNPRSLWGWLEKREGWELYKCTVFVYEILLKVKGGACL